MAKTAAKKLDEALAAELGLKLSDYTAMLHHVKTLNGILDGFIFVYTKDDNIHYDYVYAWSNTNCKRLRMTQFLSNDTIDKRLLKRQYTRWYVYGGGTLIPVNITKYEDLKDSFIFLMDNNPNYRVFNIATPECPVLRDKPLWRSPSFSELDPIKDKFTHNQNKESA